MKLSEVPKSPAYLVFHDAYDNGAMEVWPVESLDRAKELAKTKQEHLDNNGYDECGFYRAYEKLPRKKIYRFHCKILWNQQEVAK